MFQTFKTACQTDVHSATQSTQIAQDRNEWKNKVTEAMDTNGLSFQPMEKKNVDI